MFEGASFFNGEGEQHQSNHLLTKSVLLPHR